MPFGLKNAGATYQRLMDKVLAPMLGRNVQAYVDDMVVTSLEKKQAHLRSGGVVYHNRQVQIKAEPREVHFWRRGREVLGFLLN